MKSRNEIIKLIFYTSIFIPIIVFCLEIIFLFINKSNTKLTNGTKYDSLTGWRENCDNKYSNPENYNFLICDRNGFIKTPFEYDKKQKDNYGILLLGNSVAMGEGLYGFDNEKTFASKLEKNLRNKNPKIDLINAAYAGFNTWQEHVETFRYLNSEPFNDELPPLSLIVSFGGIQDFWSFIRLLSTKNKNIKDYSFANGMMLNESNIEYINFLTSSSLGNIKSGFYSLLNSVKTSSNFLSYLDYLAKGKKIKPGFYEKNQLTINIQPNNNLNLKEILNQRFNLDFKEYEKIKNYAIKSTLRNVSSISNLSPDIKYIYVYAPNYFSSLSEEQLNDSNYSYLIGVKHLVGNPIFPLKVLEREMHLIEKDYRDTLFKELKRYANISHIDFSEKADSTSWFLDYSHFNEFAASKLSSMLAEEIYNLIKK